KAWLIRRESRALECQRDFPIRSARHAERGPRAPAVFEAQHEMPTRAVDHARAGCGVKALKDVVVFDQLDLLDFVPAADGTPNLARADGGQDVADEAIVDPQVLRDAITGGGERTAAPDAGEDFRAGQA